MIHRQRPARASAKPRLCITHIQLSNGITIEYQSQANYYSIHLIPRFILSLFKTLFTNRHAIPAISIPPNKSSSWWSKFKDLQVENLPIPADFIQHSILQAQCSGKGQIEPLSYDPVTAVRATSISQQSLPIPVLTGHKVYLPVELLVGILLHLMRTRSVGELPHRKNPQSLSTEASGERPNLDIRLHTRQDIKPGSQNRCSVKLSTQIGNRTLVGYDS